MNIDERITAPALAERFAQFWALSAEKMARIERNFDPALGAPVFTVNGRYTARGWTEWTQGFQFGSMLLQFDAAGDARWLERGRAGTFQVMPLHITHRGVHDHGFNTVSTFGNLLRLHLEHRVPPDPWQRTACELAIKASAAVQAMRWTALPDGGFIYSFNGPHSLFADTIRSLRVLALGHRLGHLLMDENDARVSLLERLVLHARTTARYTVFYGEGRDAYDTAPGRVAHESLFNINDGRYRCPASQQGYSPFTTWTRGLAWIMLGFAEQLEFLDTLPPAALDPWGGATAVRTFMERAARAASDFYIANSAADGIPYWDTGAPELHRLGAWRERPAEPFNDWEPVDSSAAAIAAQGLLRLGHWLSLRGGGQAAPGRRYFQAGLTVLDALLRPPYLAENPEHEGLILHSLYHRPNGWDAVPAGRKVPCGEASMWGDYHAREAVLLVQRLANNEPYLTFWGPQP